MRRDFDDVEVSPEEGEAVLRVIAREVAEMRRNARVFHVPYRLYSVGQHTRFGAVELLT